MTDFIDPPIAGRSFPAPPTMQTGTPVENGMYVAYVDPDVPGIPFAGRRLLMFIDNRWGYLSSDQYYRGAVCGYVGPLPAMSIGDIKPKD